MYYRLNRDFPPFDNSHGLMRKSTEFHSHERKQNAHEVTPWAVFQGGRGDTDEGEGGGVIPPTIPYPTNPQFFDPPRSSQGKGFLFCSL